MIGNPQAILIMKVGFHGRESLVEIMKRKAQEETDAGVVFWGYGGTLCNPKSVVRPFSAICQERNLPIKFLMVETPSKFEYDPTAAEEFSSDGENWTPLPSGITVAASRFALVLKNLRLVEDEVDLAAYEVGIGPKKGLGLHEYIRWRVDKGVALLRENPPVGVSQPVKICCVADIVAPYSVLLRRRPSDL